MSLRTLLVWMVTAAALSACATNPSNSTTAQAQPTDPDCLSREVATGSNMVRRVGCNKVNVTEAEAARERLNAIPSRAAPEGAR